MSAGQTIVRVRSDQTSLSAEVASLLPSEMGRARASVHRSQATRRNAIVQTTFCPICGGNKGKTAARCAKCRDAAQSRGATQARSDGHLSVGRMSAARALVNDAAREANPERRDDSERCAPTWSRRVRGAGEVHRQPWRRMVMLDGKWIAEDETPEGMERADTDAVAILKLRGVR